MAGVFLPAAPVGRGAAGGGRGGIQLTRLEILEAAFTFEKDQKKTVKTLLDDTHKGAAPIRDELARTRQALGATIQGGKPQADIDQAARKYAEQVAAMTAAETAALAKLLKLLDKDLQKPAAIQAAFFLTRGIFLGTRGWDNIPDARLYLRTCRSDATAHRLRSLVEVRSSPTASDVRASVPKNGLEGRDGAWGWGPPRVCTGRPPGGPFFPRRRARRAGANLYTRPKTSRAVDLSAGLL